MEAVKQNKMGVMPVGKLLVNVSLPIVMSMLVQALYNVVDSIFVARLSEEALTAVSLAFPVQNLMIAVGVGTAVGMASLLSRRLGEQRADAASRVAGNGIFLSLLNWVVFAIVGLAFSGIYFAGYAADATVGSAIAQMGESYMRLVCVASLGLFMSVTMERLLQSTGSSIYSMIAQMAGAITNIILDPIMIFGLLGFPAMGVTGAALATVIGQFTGMFVGLFFNLTRNKEIQFRVKNLIPHWKTIKHTYSVGFPSIIMLSIGSVMVFFMNSILVQFGATPVSVLGVYFKLQSFVFMPVLGLSNGMVPIVAYNYGAQKPTRIEQTIRLSLIISFAVMVAGTLLFWLIPGPLLSLFDAGADMREIGIQALRAISLTFPMAAISIMFTGVFQALGRGLYSLVISVVRQLFFLLPFAWLFARLGGLGAVWYAFPAAEGIALVLSSVFFVLVWRKIIKPIVEKPLAQGPEAIEAAQETASL